MAPILDSIRGGSFTGVRARLDSLGADPPQVLLFEGGSETQRWDMALYWACRCKCPAAERTGTPCLECATCVQCATQQNLDLLAYDGRISNTEDEANPEARTRALNMENIRALKSALRDPPHGVGPRVVVLTGIEGRRSSAANALLKALEEPSPTSVFVLLAMQREQVLPTLVSRSFVITLPWPDPEEIGRELAGHADLWGAFLHNGQGLFDATGARDFSAADARGLLLAFRKALLRACADGGPFPVKSPEKALQALSPADRVQISAWLGEAQDTLAAGVTPARVIDAFAASVYTRLTGR